MANFPQDRPHLQRWLNATVALPLLVTLVKVPVAEKEKGGEAPADKKAAAKTKKKPSTYVVKKGDTLEKIASKHSTSIAALMKVNKIKLNEPLYVNRKLIIPTEEDI